MRLRRKAFSFLLLVISLRHTLSFMLTTARARLVGIRLSKLSTRMSSSSSDALHELASSLVTANKENDRFRACLVVAGGGGQAIAALSCTPGASSLLQEGTVAYDRASFWRYLCVTTDDDDDFQYVSEQTAKMLSKAALNRSMEYVSNVGSIRKCVGVACTSSLLAGPGGRPGRVSRGHVCATMADGRQWGCNIKLALHSGRTRLEEDVAMSRFLLQSLNQLADIDQGGGSAFLMLEEGDEMQTWQRASTKNDAALEGANRILSEDATAVLLLPNDENNGFVQMDRVILPAQETTLIFPGSFNPPHQGHLALASAALKALNLGEAGSAASVLMEMSLTNPDKPTMDPTDVSRRTNLFFQLPKENLPRDWGVLLTSAPLFKTKVENLRQGGNTGKLVFVIGTDTMVRIIDPKYYGNSQDEMLQAVREMGRQGVSYVVGGRLEQGTKEGQESEFVSGEEELKALPSDVQEIFTLVDEEDFRMDISSTELRKKAREEETVSPPVSN